MSTPKSGEKKKYFSKTKSPRENIFFRNTIAFFGRRKFLFFGKKQKFARSTKKVESPNFFPKKKFDELEVRHSNKIVCDTTNEQTHFVFANVVTTCCKCTNCATRVAPRNRDFLAKSEQKTQLNPHKTGFWVFVAEVLLGAVRKKEEF